MTRNEMRAVNDLYTGRQSTVNNKIVNQRDWKLLGNTGKIYLFGQSDGLYKIWLTKVSIKSMLVALQGNNQYTVECIFAINIDANKLTTVEKQIHTKYQNNNIRSEWFRFSDDEANTCITYMNEINEDRTTLIRKLPLNNTKKQ